MEHECPLGLISHLDTYNFNYQRKSKQEHVHLMILFFMALKYIWVRDAPDNLIPVHIIEYTMTY